MDPLLLLGYFAVPATITLVAFVGLKLHERSIADIDDVLEANRALTEDAGVRAAEAAEDLPPGWSVQIDYRADGGPVFIVHNPSGTQIASDNLKNAIEMIKTLKASLEKVA